MSLLSKKGELYIKFAIFGLGYVGLSLATLISKEYPVVAIDVVASKIDKINIKRSPIVDQDIQSRLENDDLMLVASTDANLCRDADFVIISTPTNYDAETNTFDTSSITSVIKKVNDINPNCTIVIKSTIPVGFTEKLYSSGAKNVLFSPEFLREGKALHDNLYPSRIIVGTPSGDEYLLEKGEIFASVLRDCSKKKDVKVLLMGSTEAESVKLFSNTYLAMRVAFFNELDSFAESQGLNTRDIISGVSLDPRVGDHYNNPSFGYGGYCLPKDTKQLSSNFGNVSHEVIRSISLSNEARKTFIADSIIKTLKTNGTVGAYKLAMKAGSDNYRESSIISVLNLLSTKGIRTIIYDPNLSEKNFEKHVVISDLKRFKEESNIILTNRKDGDLDDVAHKVYTRDVFNRD